MIQDKPIPKTRNRRRRHSDKSAPMPSYAPPATFASVDPDRYAHGGEWGAMRTRYRDEILGRDDTDPATRGVQLLAQAFSAGQSFDRTHGRMVIAGCEQASATYSQDDERPAVAPGLVIVKRTETEQRAGFAVNPKDRRQARLLARADPEQAQTAQAWSDTHTLRTRGKRSAYNTREARTWTASGGVAFVPVNPSAAKTMRALARADLTGPLPHLLLFAATLEVRHWLTVQRYMVACGHPPWACEQVALEFYGLDRTNADGARHAGVRAEVWIAQVGRARRRVDSWLDRAGPRIAENVTERGRLVADEVYMVDGQIRILDGGERPREARDPATYSGSEPSAMMAESWWRPERVGLNRHGRNVAEPAQMWHGQSAAAHCAENPTPTRIFLGNLDMDEAPDLEESASPMDW